MTDILDTDTRLVVAGFGHSRMAGTGDPGGWPRRLAGVMNATAAAGFSRASTPSNSSSCSRQRPGSVRRSAGDSGASPRLSGGAELTVPANRGERWMGWCVQLRSWGALDCRSYGADGLAGAAVLLLRSLEARTGPPGRCR